MADELAEDDLDWSGMTDEQRAKELLAAYRNWPGVVPEEVDGVVWLRLPVSGLLKLGNRVSGLGSSDIREAHRVLGDQGLRRSEGTGRGMVHWVRAEGMPEATPGSEVSDEDLLARAADRIAYLEAEVERLKQTQGRQLAARERLRKLLDKKQ